MKLYKPPVVIYEPSEETEDKCMAEVEAALLEQCFILTSASD